MTAQDARPFVILFDNLPLRRAAFLRLFELWAREHAFDIAPGIFEDAGAPADPARRRPALQILVLGSLRVDDPSVRSQIAELRRLGPQTPLVLISDHAERGEMLAAFRSGAQGFFPSGLDPDVALQAIPLILAGGTFFPPEMLDGPGRGTATGRVKGQGPTLTPRQIDVLSLLREGKSNKMIARDLAMCESTVKVHVRQIMRKLGAANRTQAALSTLPLTADEPGIFPVSDIPIDQPRRVSKMHELRAPASGSARAR
jgi:DNA-binding NarL/FixJ family response regulator